MTSGVVDTARSRRAPYGGGTAGCCTPERRPHDHHHRPRPHGRDLPASNADGDEQRRIAAAFALDVEHRAPIGVTTGVGPLVEFRRQLTAEIGALTVTARRAPDLHNDRARVPWDIVLADGTSFGTGTDVLELDGDGRVRAITTFIDRPPAGFDLHAHGEEEPARAG